MRLTELRLGILAVPAVFLASAGSLVAEELWSWHSVDFTVMKTAAFEWGLHTRLRTREGELQQGRSGSILRFRPHPRFSLMGGYYYGREEDTRQEWRNSHRLFGGAEAGVYRKGGVSVAARGLVERFIVDSRPDFMRFRHRLRLSTNHRIGPFVGAEWFFDRKGYLAGRYSGGLRWRCSSWSSVEFGYLYDARSPQLGPSRHGIITNVLLERRQKEQPGLGRRDQ
jgi:hypothetical protein